MSESNLESLLSKLSLAAPSKELDDRMIACLEPPASDAQPALNHLENRKSFFPAAIAAALLVGSVVGFLVGHRTNPSERKAVAGFAPTTKSQESPRMGSHVSKSTITTQLAGPEVTVACALVKFAGSPQIPNTACQDCHSGLAESINSFRQRHLLLAEFATCNLCHAADVSLNSAGSATLF